MSAILSSTPNSNDLSNQILAELFGINWWNSAVPQAGFIYEILRVMNTIALSFASFLMVYTLAMAVISTAHEGKPLGTRMNTIWVPIRTLIGISFLAPVFSGLSVLQVTMMSIVAMSISAGNFVTSTALNQINLSAADTVQQNPQLRENARFLAEIVLTTQIAQVHAESTGWPMDPRGIFIIENLDDDMVRFQFTTNQNTGHTRDMGYIDICNNGSIVCDTRQQAISDMIDQALPVAASIVQKALDQEGWGGIPDNTLDNLVSPYLTAVTASIDTFMTQQHANFNTDDFVNNTNRDGWLSMGTIYWQYSRLNAKIFEVVSNSPAATPSTGEGFGIATSIVGANIAQTYWQRHQQTTYKKTEDMDLKDIRSMQGAQKYLRVKINNIVDPMLYSASDALTKGDIVQNLSNMGHSSLLASEMLLFTGAAASGLTRILDSADEGIIGSVLNFTSGGVTGAVLNTIGVLWKNPQK